jgi:hypothetical protein
MKYNFTSGVVDTLQLSDWSLVHFQSNALRQPSIFKQVKG